MFFFGWGRKIKLLGQTLMRNCGRCGKQSVWSISKQYRYFSIFFVPVARWNVEWLHLCPVCNHGENVTKQEAERLLGGQKAGVPASSQQFSVYRVEVDQNGTRTESYYHDGKLHREYGPAIVETNADGSWSEDYYGDGELDRADGPALIEVAADGARTESYYRRGLPYDPAGALTPVS